MDLNTNTFIGDFTWFLCCRKRKILGYETVKNKKAEKITEWMT